MRVEDHPILGKAPERKNVTIIVDGEPMTAQEGEPIAAALAAVAKRVLRHTKKRHEPRGFFCGLGRCSDCLMTVNDVPQVRTCITLVEDGMCVETQEGLGMWSEE